MLDPKKETKRTDGCFVDERKTKMDCGDYESF